MLLSFTRLTTLVKQDMDSILPDSSYRLSRIFQKVDRAYDFVAKEYIYGLFLEADCGLSDVSFLFNLIMRIFDHITGMRIVRRSCHGSRCPNARERRACLRIRLNRLRYNLGDASILESTFATGSSFRVFVALLRIWSHTRNLQTIWSGWMIQIFHHEFQKYLHLI